MSNVRWIVLTVFLLASCTSLGPRPEAPASVERARALDKAGDYAGAARAYEALAAQNSGTEQNAFLLQAAAEHLRARNPQDAARVLASITPPFTADQTFERQMLGIELALARNQGQEAWRQISAIAQPAGGPGALRYLALRQKAAFATGRAADGVRAEIVRERLLANPDDRAAARSELLADLRSAQEGGAWSPRGGRQRRAWLARARGAGCRRGAQPPPPFLMSKRGARVIQAILQATWWRASCWASSWGRASRFRMSRCCCPCQGARLRRASACATGS
jgi:hypothetical protein